MKEAIGGIGYPGTRTDSGYFGSRHLGTSVSYPGTPDGGGHLGPRPLGSGRTEAALLTERLLENRSNARQ